jgi:hypothetical protein
MLMIICAAIALVTVAFAWKKQSPTESIPIPVRVSENIYPSSRTIRR